MGFANQFCCVSNRVRKLPPGAQNQNGTYVFALCTVCKHTRRVGNERGFNEVETIQQSITLTDQTGRQLTMYNIQVCGGAERSCGQKDVSQPIGFNIIAPQLCPQLLSAVGRCQGRAQRRNQPTSPKSLEK